MEPTDLTNLTRFKLLVIYCMVIHKMNNTNILKKLVIFFPQLVVQNDIPLVCNDLVSM